MSWNVAECRGKIFPSMADRGDCAICRVVSGPVKSSKVRLGLVECFFFRHDGPFAGAALDGCACVRLRVFGRKKDILRVRQVCSRDRVRGRVCRL